MTREEARAQFAQIIAHDEHNLELDRAALLIAAEQYPRLDIEIFLAQLDSFAEAAQTRDDFYADPLVRIMRLGNLLFEELGFHGNTDSYFDARNSFLNDVIERRVGIPITLSVIMTEVARRIGLRLFGVGMPGHFLVKYADDEQEIFIDPFHGGRILNEERCREMIEEMYNGEISFHPSFLYASTKKQILSRMLQNLKNVYARAKDHYKTLGVIERMLLINPDSETELRDRGLVYFGMGQYVQARADLEAYLRLEPEAEDASEIKNRLRDLQRRQAQLN